MDTEYRTPSLRDGLLVHMPYTTYAHWFQLRQLLDGAGVTRVQVHFDIDSMSRPRSCAASATPSRPDARTGFA